MYVLAYLLPATFTRSAVGSGTEPVWRVTGWGWQLALLSVMPVAGLVQSATVEILFAMVTITPSNVCFVAAAIALWRRKRQAAIILACIALASMIYGGFVIQEYPGDLIRVPYGRLGPGYYIWILSGIVLLWTAFSSRSAA